MPDKILVLGGTGPAGICLIRELVHRNHSIIVYARDPSKIPDDLVSSPLIEIVKGGLDELDKLAKPLANCTAIVSLLGPNIKSSNISPTTYSEFYKALFPMMRQHGVRRILAMGTTTIQRPEDHWAFMPRFAGAMLWLFINKAYSTVLGIAAAFDDEATGLDWTVYRIAMIPGDSDEASWRRDRDAGPVFSGWVGEKGWTFSTPRGALARWLVDAVEGGADAWFGKMPAVSLRGA